MLLAFSRKFKFYKKWPWTVNEAMKGNHHYFVETNQIVRTFSTPYNFCPSILSFPVEAMLVKKIVSHIYMIGNKKKKKTLLFAMINWSMLYRKLVMDPKYQGNTETKFQVKMENDYPCFPPTFDSQICNCLSYMSSTVFLCL
jgi:hypothetical protein